MAEHPITPPPELVQQWRNLPEYTSQLRMMSSVTLTTEKLQDIATQAARWGADQELEACCEWLKGTAHIGIDFELLHTRRPKLQSLKEQALTALSEADQGLNESEWQQRSETIRRALEQLDD
jgi:hypothetical protein